MNKPIGKAAATRIRLIEATIDLLNERDLARVTFVEVARRAGLSRGAMHHHFENRTALLEEVIDHIGLRVRQQVRADIDRSLSEESTLASIVDFTWEQLNNREYRTYERIRRGLQSDGDEQLIARMRSITDTWTNAAANLLVERNSRTSELPRIVLAALTGAAATLQSVGGPSGDEDFRLFRDQLKALIDLAEKSD